MSDRVKPTRIYLQPECCAEPDLGRLWCEDDEPVECEDGESWTEYVAVDEVLRMIDVEIAGCQTKAKNARRGHLIERWNDRADALMHLRTRFEGGTDE